MQNSAAIEMPQWLLPACGNYVQTTNIEAQMRFVIELSKMNVSYETGGPFGAAVFELETGRLLSAGVNRVVPLSSSILHAEMTALLFAQQSLGSYSISAAGREAVLVSSCEPCAMCMGAIPWAGLSALVCGARDEDARKAGFDEGDKPQGWVEKLENRGIKVTQDVLRDEAAKVIRDFALSESKIYNG
ncbi:Guanine deaminase [Limihaloglobus sulfuriphilus]|uniref:Guanine deaminase n=1 Tax=Limihaloglobus sulfuriphilus TaxID=1851148 RepID=A0A1Q2MCF4_9BACT|nr:nucleoside deaminase [Limihaloglobus sulfuriphilus]AQQ70381.1 Guanine deaminase [Limihaloglobus sulfuriphilus]